MAGAATLGAAAGRVGSGSPQACRLARGYAGELLARLVALVVQPSLCPPVLGVDCGPGEHPRLLRGGCCLVAAASLRRLPRRAVLLWFAGSVRVRWFVPPLVLARPRLAAVAGRGNRADPWGCVGVVAVAATAFASGSRGPAAAGVQVVAVLLVPLVAVGWHFLLWWTSLLLLLVRLLGVPGAAVGKEAPPWAAAGAAVEVVARRCGAFASRAWAPAPALSPQWGPCQDAAGMLAASPRHPPCFAAGPPAIVSSGSVLVSWPGVSAVAVRVSCCKGGSRS